LTKIAALPEAAQERIARDLLDRIDALSNLRAEIDIGLKELDEGLGSPLDLEAISSGKSVPADIVTTIEIKV